MGATEIVRFNECLLNESSLLKCGSIFKIINRNLRARFNPILPCLAFLGEPRAQIGEIFQIGANKTRGK